MSRVDNIINGVRTSGTVNANEKKKSRVASIIEAASNGNLNTGVDNSYIQSFVKDANDLLSSTSKGYKDIGYSNASSFYDDYTLKSDELRKQANTIRAYLNSNRNNIDENTYNTLMDSLDNFERGRTNWWNQLRNASEFYSQFDSEDAYNSWYEDYTEKQKVLGADDFEENSKYVSTKSDNWWKDLTSQYGMGFDDLTY